MSEHFRPLTDHELARRSDEQVIAYARAAREHPAEYERAIWHLLSAHLDTIRARLSFRMPPHLVDDMTQDVFADVFVAIDGEQEIGNFRAWLNQLLRNRIAEYYRGPGYAQLVRDREGAARTDAEDVPLPEPAVEGGYGVVELEDAIERVLATRVEAHRQVIELYCFDGHSARATAQATGQTEDNVFKIAERFRKDLRAALGGDTGSSP